MVNFVGIIERENWTSESWTEQGDINQLYEDFKHWHPVINDIINHINPDDLYQWALLERPPLTNWVDGRAVLLGDAAHPMLPFMAQGAAMAIEDGWILADSLSRHDKIDKALSNYQQNRQDRTRKVQTKARANMKTFHRAKGLASLTYWPMRLAGYFAPELIRHQFNWIYNYNAANNTSETKTL